MLGPWCVEPHQQIAQRTHERPQLYIVYIYICIYTHTHTQTIHGALTFLRVASKVINIKNVLKREVKKLGLMIVATPL